MARFKTKPVEIEGIKYTGDNFDEIDEFVELNPEHPGRLLSKPNEEKTAIVLKVWNELEDQWIQVPEGHWVLRGLKGEYYPCEEEVLFMKYELVEE